MQSMKVLITGAGGFVGSWVARWMLEQRQDVHLLLADKKEIPGALLDRGRVETYRMDLLALDELKPLLREADLCIHCALGWGATPLEHVRSDLVLTAFILGEAASNKHRKFIYTSSVNAIGLRSPFMDEETRCRPNTLYSATKAANESFVSGWSRTSGLPCAVVRPAYVFGMPAWEGAGPLVAQEFPDLVEKVLGNRDIQLRRHDGAQFLAAEDLAGLYGALLDRDFRFEIYNAPGKAFIPWAKVAEKLIEMTGSRSRVSEVDGIFPEKPNTFSGSKAAALLGREFDASGKLETFLEHLIATRRAA